MSKSYRPPWLKGGWLVSILQKDGVRQPLTNCYRTSAPTMKTPTYFRWLLLSALILALPGCTNRRAPNIDAFTWNTIGWERLYYWDGSRYQGSFDRKFDRDGPGTYIYPNGDRLIAIFRNGMVVGRATVLYANGKKYVGEFRNNRLTGQGTLFYSNGDRYDGRFISGKRQGRGIYTYADGRQYTGEFNNDQISGPGVLVYANGDRYQGQFHDGQPQGLGRMEFANGRTTLEGRWDQGEFVWPQLLKF